MGIRFSCPNGHNLNVKTFLAGKRGVCPQCGARFVIPGPSELRTSEVGRNGTLTESQTVGTISATAVHTPAVAASPSIIVSVADAKVSDEASGAQSPANSSIVPVPPTPIAPLAAASPPPRVPRPGRRRQFQLMINVLLFLLVVVLAIVLFIVMRRQLSQQPAVKKTHTAAAGSNSVHQLRS